MESMLLSGWMLNVAVSPNYGKGGLWIHLSHHQKRICWQIMALAYRHVQPRILRPNCHSIGYKWYRFFFFLLDAVMCPICQEKKKKCSSIGKFMNLARIDVVCGPMSVCGYGNRLQNHFIIMYMKLCQKQSFFTMNKLHVKLTINTHQLIRRPECTPLLKLG